MSLLDDTAIFAAIVQQGGFSHAAKHLGLSNGLITRRIQQLEKKLGVTLLTRTTRQIKLTPEGEVLWQHAKRIQQELNSALSMIHSSAKKPSGHISLSAPMYFGRQYLTPIIMKFLANFPQINIDLMLSNQQFDPIQHQFDLIIRGSGLITEAVLKDSSLKMKLICHEKIGLYVSPEYLVTHGEPKTIEDLAQHTIIHFTDQIQQKKIPQWSYELAKKKDQVMIHPAFNCNDIESSLTACLSGYGISRLTSLNVQTGLAEKKLVPILQQYDWGDYYLYAIYPQQQALPTRTRLLLDFIMTNLKTDSLL